MRTMALLTAILTFVVQAGDLPAGLTQTTGVDKGSGIAYVLISLDGQLVSSGSIDAHAQTPPPRLTAVCLRYPGGKLKFELMADFGAVTEIAYVPPWKPASPQDLPPRVEKAQVTMEFLGYTRVKPVKRAWEYLPTIAGELRYATPGIGSSNMEEIRYYMQYLKSLPTLRLTLMGKGSAEWVTAIWQQRVHAEPMCEASGL